MFSSWWGVTVGPETVSMVRMIKQLNFDVTDGGAC
jgi:hypothetical protein